MSNLSAKTSPIGARRVRTDLKTSENIFLAKYSNRSRKTSPIGIKQVPNHYQQQQQQQQNHHFKEQNYYQQTHRSIVPAISQQEQKQHNTRIPKATANLAQTQSSRRTSTATVATNRYSIAANAFSNIKCTNYLSTSAPTDTYATVPSAHLPARATRLLNRSRLQQQCPISNADSDSSKSAHSVRRSVAASRASSASTASNASLHRNTHLHQRDSHSSSDDLMLYDKSFRNAMIQEVLQFKKQLLRLRRILQEDEDGLTRVRYHFLSFTF
ncbi:ras-interacting protein RIP3-like [Teleopsis dalmanni]|uniref:ras-interacting protein RIP3-like n=1 Tax=Teleopsis dalmanni TaxID=139649 RepID=UPI0018CCCE7A|nr:ras-interacting protein RIP3-like [Teleopsis dalmanni]